MSIDACQKSCNARGCNALGLSTFVLMLSSIVLSHFGIFGVWLEGGGGKDLWEGRLATGKFEITLWKITTAATVFTIQQPQQEISFDDVHLCGASQDGIHMPEEDCGKFHSARHMLIAGLVMASLATISSVPIICLPRLLNRICTHYSRARYPAGGNSSPLICTGLPRLILLQRFSALFTATFALMSALCIVLVCLGAVLWVKEYSEKPWVKTALSGPPLPIQVSMVLREGVVCTVLQLLFSLFSTAFMIRYWRETRQPSADYINIETPDLYEELVVPSAEVEPAVESVRVLKHILVTGANTGIGLALSKQLAVDHGCQVYIGSRSTDKGEAALNSILDAQPDTTVKLVQVDTLSDESVTAAAKVIGSMLGTESLYAIVNNASTGPAGGLDAAEIIDTNLFGTKRICEAFLPLLNPTEGRIVNVGCSAGPDYVRNCSDEVKKQLCNEDQTWEAIEEYLESVKAEATSWDAYGLSKALLANYTSLLAKENPALKINCCSPDIPDTSDEPLEDGTTAIRHLLFEELAGNGWYYGSDAVRSPLHMVRKPGESAYDGQLDFISTDMPVPNEDSAEILKHILVTGSNKGIGFILCRQLAVDHCCHVYMGSRSKDQGEAAVKSILDAHSDAKVEFVQVDMLSDESVAAAVKTVESSLGSEALYAIVNNASTGPGADAAAIIDTNLFGTKRVCEAFLPLLNPAEGRIVNVGCSAGPDYVSTCPDEVKKQLCSEDQSWEAIEAHLQSVKPEETAGAGFGLSKALLSNYTSLLAKENTTLKINCCTPGSISSDGNIADVHHTSEEPAEDTSITDIQKASQGPAEDSTFAIRHLLFEKLAGNGWYYGSDALRSPLHFVRSSGEPAYDGAMPCEDDLINVEI